MDERILARVDRAAGVDDLAGVLDRLAPTDLQSLLLEVYRRRVGRASASTVLAQYRQNRFVSPAAGDPRALNRFEAAALSGLPAGYEPVELSPVAPLGVSAVLGRLNQDWAVATARNTEVVSDSTNVLALECAVRRRADRTQAVKLASGHRLLRGQDFGERGAQHFHVFCLVAAGRTGAFQVEALVEQVEYFRQVLGDVRVALTPLDGGRVADAVNERFDGSLEIDTSRTSGRDYYVDVCFKLYRGDLEVGDGGFVDWTKALLGDRKEALLIGGIGTDRAIASDAR
jgi:hypothetical protein